LPKEELCKAIIDGHTKILVMDPSDAEAYEQRAAARCHLGRYADAIADYDMSINLGLNSASAYHGRALAKWLLRSNEADPNGAKRDFTIALKMDDDELQPTIKHAEFFYLDRGWSKRRAGDYKGALRDFNKARVVNPESLYAPERQADMMRQLGDHRGAIHEYNRALELDPDQDRAYFFRGKAKLGANDPLGALEDYERAIYMNENTRYLFGLAELKRDHLQDYDGAIEDYSTLVRMQESLLDAYLGRGAAKLGKEDFQGAMSDFDAALQLSPEHAAAYILRANAKDDQGDYEGALADYELALKFDERAASAHIERGIAALRVDDFEGALADFEKAVLVKPDCAEGFARHGRILCGRKDYPQAMRDILKAIELEPENASHYDDRAFLKLCTNDRAGAIADCEKAAELDPLGVYYRSVLYAFHILGNDYSKAEAVQHEIEMILNRPVHAVWEIQVGHFLTGAMSENELLGCVATKNAGREKSRRCAAHFAIGINLLREGRKADAVRHFQKAVETNKKGNIEYQLAAACVAELHD
jgi:tetratricopeptide (TPR) repeat protein